MKPDTIRKLVKELAFYLFLVGLGIIWVIWMFRETEHSVNEDQVLGSMVVSSVVYGLIWLGRLAVRAALTLWAKHEKIA